MALCGHTATLPCILPGFERFHGVVDDDHVKPGHRDTVKEEPGGGFFEVPPVESHGQCQPVVKAKDEKTARAIKRDGCSGDPECERAAAAGAGDTEQIARNAHDQQPAQAQMNGHDDKSPVTGQGVQLARGKAPIARQDAGQRIRYKQACGEEHDHGVGQQRDHDQIDRAARIRQRPGLCEPAAIKAVVDDDQEE
jgi:hypothetical protein